MKLDNEFTVGVPVSQAWDVLTDLELIAPCMPGAVLTGVDDGVYTGKVKVKVGPISAEYSGTAQFTEKDEASHRAVINARGRDSRGNGNATAVISAQLRADGDKTAVTVTTDLTLAGRIAQFGSGMIKEVSAKLLRPFVTSLEAKLGGHVPAAVDTVDQAAAGPVDAKAVAPPGSAVGTGAGATNAAAPLAHAPADGESAPIDLMSVAGSAIYKRLVPAVVGLAVLGVIIYLIVR